MKSAIFDIDGTMFLNKKWHMLAWKRLLTGKYERPFTEDDFNERMFGPTNERIITWLFDGRVKGEELASLSLAKEEMFREVCRREKDVSLAPGLPAFLDELARRGVPRTIATGAPIGNLKFYFELFHLEKWFDFSLAVYDDCVRPGKPDPAIYREAARVIGQDPADCVVFEDAVPGLTSAKGAGIGRVVMIDSTLPREKLEGLPGVSCVIHDFTDMETLFRVMGE